MNRSSARAMQSAYGPRRRLAWALPLVLAWSCSQNPPEAASPPPTEPASAAAVAEPGIVQMAPSAARAAGVRTEVVEVSKAANRLEVAARITLDEDRTARVGSFVEGVVVECCKPLGAYVRKGEVLASVHSHSTHEVVAEYVTARAELHGRESELEYARQTHERARRLFELKAGPLQAVQQAAAQERTAETAVAAAQASLERASAHLDFFGLDPDAVENPAQGEEPYIDIRAPASGVVVERGVKLGDVVTPSTEMYVLSDLSRVWAIAQVPEQELGSVRAGMAVEVRTRAFPDRVFPGRVVLVSSELDPETLTVQARCSAPNPGGVLKTGMYAEVVLESKAAREALRVPSEAVQRLEEAPIVFVSVAADRFAIRPVQLGARAGGEVEILEGLRAGERVAVSGAFVLKSQYLRSELEGGEH